MNPDPHPTLHRILPEPNPDRDERVGATTWVPLLAFAALLIALGLYFFDDFSPSPNMRADTNPVTVPVQSPN